MKKKLTWAQFKQFIPLYVMMLPSLIYIFINNYIPMAGIVVAFKKYNVNDGMFGSAWCGLNNFKFNPFSMSVDAAASYKVYTIDGGKRNLQFPITVGGGAALAITVAEKPAIDFSVLVPVGIEYTFADVPITLYLRLAPGVQFFKNTEFKMGFAFAGYIGALWNF